MNKELLVWILSLIFIAILIYGVGVDDGKRSQIPLQYYMDDLHIPSRTSVDCVNWECTVKSGLLEVVKIDQITGSMFPLVRNDSVTLLTTSTQGQILHLGDIVFVRIPEERIHRIVAFRDNLICTKGDNNLWEDGCFTSDKIDRIVVGVLY